MHPPYRKAARNALDPQSRFIFDEKALGEQPELLQGRVERFPPFGPSHFRRLLSVRTGYHYFRRVQLSPSGIPTHEALDTSGFLCDIVRHAANGYIGGSHVGQETGMDDERGRTSGGLDCRL